MMTMYKVMNKVNWLGYAYLIGLFAVLCGFDYGVAMANNNNVWNTPKFGYLMFNVNYFGYFLGMIAGLFLLKFEENYYHNETDNSKFKKIMSGFAKSNILRCVILLVVAGLFILVTILPVFYHNLPVPFVVALYTVLQFVFFAPLIMLVLCGKVSLEIYLVQVSVAQLANPYGQGHLILDDLYNYYPNAVVYDSAGNEYVIKKSPIIMVQIMYFCWVFVLAYLVSRYFTNGLVQFVSSFLKKKFNRFINTTVMPKDEMKRDKENDDFGLEVGGDLDKDKDKDK
eukprot:Pgem_evm1s2890